jgi:hypothetical protein
MCTLVCRWAPTETVPLQMLALRDELASRAFDLPGNWWPDQPLVVGGRDRSAGGTWCASDVATGVTAVVLNRGERRTAAQGAPSRGVLPLLAIRSGPRWPDVLDVTPMASFNLVLATPDSLTWWSFDGTNLVTRPLRAGTHMFTPQGLAVPLLDARFAQGHAVIDADLTGSTDQVWQNWLPIIADNHPQDDPLALLVRIPIGEDVFETVFGQLIAARPGALRLDYVVKPERTQEWNTARWHADGGVASAGQSGAGSDR